MGEADAETFSQTGGTGSLMVQPGSRLIQPCVEWRWHWACAELGVGGAVAVPWPAFCRKPTTPLCLPEVVLSSCPIHVKPTFLMAVIHGSSESLQVTSYGMMAWAGDLVSNLSRVSQTLFPRLLEVRLDVFFHRRVVILTLGTHSVTQDFSD